MFQIVWLVYDDGNLCKMIHYHIVMEMYPNFMCVVVPSYIFDSYNFGPMRHFGVLA